VSGLDPRDPNLSVYTQDYLDSVATELNDRPRMTLGWMDPAESSSSFWHHQPRNAVLVALTARNRRALGSKTGAGRASTPPHVTSS
jgi:hypothetical protein